MSTSLRRLARVSAAAAGLAAVALVGRALVVAPGAGAGRLGAVLAGSYAAAWAVALGLAKGSRRSVAARGAACTVSLGLGWLLIEIPAATGLVDYRAVFATPTPAWERPGNRPDPDLVFVRKGPATQRLWFLGADLHRLKGVRNPTVYRNDLRFDRDGFRNPDGRDRADVLVVGDSFVEGPHVDEPSVLTTRLAALTGRSVANLGRSGYGPDQEAAVVRRVGLAKRPSACVWAFYEGNDLGDVREYPAARETLANTPRPSRLGSMADRSFARNALDLAARTWVRPEAVRDPGRFSGRFEDGSRQGVTFYFSSDDYRPDPDRDRSPELRHVRDLLAQVRQDCRRAGASLTVVFIPTKWRVYRDACAFPAASACRDWPLDDLPGAVRASVAEAGADVAFIDLTPTLKAAAGRGEVVYLPDDTHWSADGHRLAAEAIAVAIRPAVGDAPPTLSAR